jgi:transcriptional regulator with XRE-family HTH domain
MTQHELAQATGLPQPSIARIESGVVIPRAATLIAILRATGHRLALEPTDATGDPQEVRRRLATPVPDRARKALGRRVKDPQTSPMRILRRLRGKGVPFVLVGDLAEVAHGSSGRVGRPVEVCVASTDVARERLSLAVDDLGALADGGRLRVMERTAAGDSYEVLIRNAVTLLVEAGISMRVAALEDLIRVRRARGGPRDLEAAAELTAIVRETALLAS